MKKLLLILFFTFSFHYIHSQTIQSYIAYDNSSFKVGDSVMIGFLKSQGYYNNIKTYFYKNQNVFGYEHVKLNLLGTKHVILNIYKDKDKIFDNNAYILEIGQKGFSKGYSLYVNINEAIREGEIVLNESPNFSYNKNTKPLTDTLAFLIGIKNSSTPLSFFSLEFMQRFENDTYEKYKEDEFELDNQKSKILNKIVNLTNNLESSTIYCVDIPLTIDNYDFTSLSFPVGNFYEYYIVAQSKYSKNMNIDIVFENQNYFNTFHLNKDIANNLVKRRKDSNGNVNRTLYARVYFTIITNPSNPLNNKISYDNYSFVEGRYIFIYGEIQKIEFFDFENRYYNFIGQKNYNQ